MWACVKGAYQSILPLQKTEGSAQGGEAFISIQSGTEILKTPHLTSLICACKKEEKKKKMEMFDKLLSRQKQKRDGGGRCWWQVYYATEAAGEANNWEMELSQHFAKWQISAPHQRVSLCHSSRQDEITQSDILHPSLKLRQCSVRDMKFRNKIYSIYFLRDWWICVEMHDRFMHEVGKRTWETDNHCLETPLIEMIMSLKIV